MLQHEKMGISFDQLRLRLKETLSEATTTVQQEEIQEDIRILKERIDSICEKDIEAIRGDIQLLFEYALVSDGETIQPISKSTLINSLRKRKNSVVYSQYTQPS